MAQPAAKQGDRVTATDTHLIQPPGPSSPVPLPHPFNGTLDSNLSPDVKIEGKAAAVVGSIASNIPHIPQGGTFVVPPRNKARVVRGSASVFINNKAAARTSDQAATCDDPADLPVGTVQAQGQVFIGG